MAVTRSSSAGNNLSDAVDIVNATLTTGLSTKATYTYSSSAPSSPATGQIWMDTSSGSPIGKVWTGSAWATFSGASAAQFSNTVTGTYTSGGKSYKYVTFTGTSTLTISKAGLAEVLVVGGGGGGGGMGREGQAGGGGGGGGVIQQIMYFDAGSYTVQIGGGGGGSGGGGNGGRGGDSIIYGKIFAGGGGYGAGTGGWDGYGSYPGGNGACGGGSSSGWAGDYGYGGAVDPANAPWTGYSNGNTRTGGGGMGGYPSGNAGGPGKTSTITNVSQTFGAGGNGAQNPAYAGAGNTGNGGQGIATGGTLNTAGAAGGSGIVIVRVEG